MVSGAIDCRIEGIGVCAILCSDSAVNYVSRSFACRLSPASVCSRGANIVAVIMARGDNELTVTGTLHDVEMSSAAAPSLRLTFYVVEECSHDVVLGLPWFQTSKAVICQSTSQVVIRIRDQTARVPLRNGFGDVVAIKLLRNRGQAAIIAHHGIFERNLEPLQSSWSDCGKSKVDRATHLHITQGPTEQRDIPLELLARIFSFLPSAYIISSGMKVSRALREVLPNYVKYINIHKHRHDIPVQQADLAFIARTFINLESLHISQERRGDLLTLDFTDLHFPSLAKLRLCQCRLADLTLTTVNTPNLVELSIEQQLCHPVKSFNLSLPVIESITIEHLQIHDCRLFGQSLSSCARLQQFISYKMRGLSLCGPDFSLGTAAMSPRPLIHTLRLPSCKVLILRRSDGLAGLEICAPLLRHLCLRACYFLQHLRLQWSELCDVNDTGSLEIDLVDSPVDNETLVHLRSHPLMRSRRTTLSELGIEWETDTAAAHTRQRLSHTLRQRPNGEY